MKFLFQFRFLVFLTVTMLVITTEKSASQVQLISERLKNELTSQTVNDSLITDLLIRLTYEGRWNDVDYASKSITNWPPLAHSSRLKSVCTAYRTPSSIHYHKPEVKDKIVRMIEYYIKSDPVSDNWWYNAIGAPINLGPALLLMKMDKTHGIEHNLLADYTKKLIRYYSESAEKWPFSTTGANKIWLLRSSLYKACILENEAVLRENFSSAFEEVAVMPGKEEGIKADFSFYQHGPQLYTAGYGMSFMSDITSFGHLAHQSDFQMSDAQLSILTNTLLDGYQWFIQRQAFDFGTAGREISRRGAVSASAMLTFLQRLIDMQAPRQDELKSFMQFVSGEAFFQSPGNRHFWKSDIMVQHGPDFYLSAKIPSKRTIGSERMNNENLKMKWLPWGATNIMRDGNEYRNLFSVWDWSRIPGVTSYREEVPGVPVKGGPYIVSEADYAGGVSDGVLGMAAYDYSWDGISGRKAWFFTSEGMFCLGTGIGSSRDVEVITNVNQCMSSGEVIVRTRKGKSYLEGRMDQAQDIQWVHHNQVGYFFPSGGKLTVTNMDQNGSWSSFNLSQSSETVTRKMFSAWISHGETSVGGTYEYVVIPSKRLADFEKWTRQNPFSVVSNTPALQAVSCKKSQVTGIAFYEPGDLSISPGLIISADKPCIMLVRKDNKDNGIKISIADPTQLLSEVKVTVSAQVSGHGAEPGPGRTTDIRFVLPSGDEAGKSITSVFRIASGTSKN